MTDKRDFLDNVPPPLLDEPEKLINFILWKTQFEIIVAAKNSNVWEIIESGDYIPQKVSPDGNGMVVKLESEWSEEDKIKVAENHLAIHMLYCALQDSTLQLVYRCNTAQEIWETLALIYEGNSQLKDCKIDLFTKEFVNFKMLDGESILDMECRFMSIVNCLRTLGKTLSDEICVERVLTALTPEWNDLVTKVSADKNAYGPSLSELIGNLDVMRSLNCSRNMLRECEICR